MSFQQGTPDVEDIIWSGGGAKSAEWPTVGAWVGGPVQAKPQSYEAKEYVPGQPGAGRPKLTQNGERIFGVKVDVMTNMRDPADPKDRGVRRMHLDKWRQLQALREALQDAGVRFIEPGGELWVQWTGEESDGQTAQAAKTWAAKYRPPVNSAARLTDPESAPPVQQPYTPTPSMPTAQPTPTPSVPPGPSWGQTSGLPHASSAPPVQPGQPPQNVITASVEAALKAQGIDTSAFTVVPG